jgi:hypothetical protein
VVELLERRARVDYYDPLVPSISIDEHQVMLSLAKPDPDLYDAILLNIRHPDVDYEWLRQAALVVDPSGRYNLRQRHAPAPAMDGDAAWPRSADGDQSGEPERRVAEGRSAFKVGG